MNPSISPQPAGHIPPRLTVAVDYDATCKAAADRALSLARLLRVPVHFIHAWYSPYAAEPLESAVPLQMTGDHNLIDAMKVNEAETMHRFIAELNTSNVSITWSVESGEPRRVLVEFCTKHPQDWLVLGARKHSAISEWLLGSVANYVVRHCQAPVLVVPPPEQTPQSAI